MEDPRNKNLGFFVFNTFGSSKGRTLDFGSGNVGSSPAPKTNMDLWRSWCARSPEERKDTVRFRKGPQKYRPWVQVYDYLS